MPKSILITGCSAGGIGSALAVAFQKRGLEVFATARNFSKMEHLDLPNITRLTLDVNSPSFITSAVQAVHAKTGGTLDYLVNAHGAFLIMPILDVNLEELKELFNSNVFGCIATIQGFAPLLIQAKGTVVNIGSMAAYFRAPYISPYGASKAALSLFTDTLRLELQPLGVKVLLVEGGSVKTNLMVHNDNFQLPPNTLYRSVEGKVSMYAKGEDIPEKMPVEEFAEKVASDVVGGATGKIYRGKMSTTLKYLSSLPPSVMEGGMMKSAGLDKF